MNWFTLIDSHQWIHIDRFSSIDSHQLIHINAFTSMHSHQWIHTSQQGNLNDIPYHRHKDECCKIFQHYPDPELQHRNLAASVDVWECVSCLPNSQRSCGNGQHYFTARAWHMGYLTDIPATVFCFQAGTSVGPTQTLYMCIYPNMYLSD